MTHEWRTLMPLRLFDSMAFACELRMGKLK